MLAWLFNGEREHGLNVFVFRGLAEESILQGHLKLKNALETLQNGGGEIKIEARRTDRYDLLLELPELTTVLENKTKVIENQGYLNSYLSDGTDIVVALGFCLENYARAGTRNFPLITNQEVLNAVIAAVDKGVEQGAFGILVQ